MREAIGALPDAEDELCCCALSLDEFADSARSAADHVRSAARMRSSFLFLTSWATSDAMAAEIRTLLWNAGKGRSARVVDVAIASIAAVGDAVVLHYDADFDHIVNVQPTVRVQWVVSRGSVD